MAETATDYKYIQLTDDHVPTIEGTNMKIVELIANHQTYGWSPEELHFQYPHIALSKIYSALAYYWDHKQMIDEDITKRLDRIEVLKTQHNPSPLGDQLRARGVIV
jgi:uncharacterized protein (DUF433 family)